MEVLVYCVTLFYPFIIIDLNSTTYSPISSISLIINHKATIKTLPKYLSVLPDFIKKSRREWRDFCIPFNIIHNNYLKINYVQYHMNNNLCSNETIPTQAHLFKKIKCADNIIYVEITVTHGISYKKISRCLYY